MAVHRCIHVCVCMCSRYFDTSGDINGIIHVCVWVGGVILMVYLYMCVCVSGVETQGPPPPLYDTSYKFQIFMLIENSTQETPEDWGPCCPEANEVRLEEGEISCALSSGKKNKNKMDSNL